MSSDAGHLFAVSRLLLYCREGFEGDCAAEIVHVAAEHGVSGYCRARSGSAHVLFEVTDGAVDTFFRSLHWRELIFARQWLQVLAEVEAMPRDDRVAPLVNAHGGYREEYRKLLLEHPDNNSGKSLSPLCRRLSGALARGLRERGVDPARPGAGWRLHVFFIDGDHALLAETPVHRTAPWPGGIPRLKLPAQAPSRSTLKLEEALHVFLSADERARLLRPGRKAVDLGAAPGGWTWQLVRKGMRVTAVDNGPMQPALMESGLVEHVRADGFRYRPPRPVDLLVCDMVDKPIRVTNLMARWFHRGDCRQAIFNLKLPMKRRYATASECLRRLRDSLAGAGPRGTVQARHLYHDREEVTVHVRRE